MRTFQRAAALLPFLLASLSCHAGGGAAPTAPAERVFLGGTVVPMTGPTVRATALAVRGGRIVAVGSDADVRAWIGPATQVTELAGKTLLPGFLDGHSHFINAGLVATQANVYPPPFGPGDSVEGIVGALQELVRAHPPAPGAWILAYGYDNSLFPEDAQLTKAPLDAVFPDHPVIVQHVSLHGGVLNSKALALAGITAETKTPPGGVIVRLPGSQEPAGLLMETAFLPVFETLPLPPESELVERYRIGQELYAAAGITTAHEGATKAADLAVLDRLADQDALFLDVVAYPFITELDAVLERHPIADFGRYRKHLKLGGVKITADGSPQGKTAWFTTPYLTGGPNGEPDWRGEPTFPPDVLRQMIARVYDLGLPLNVHCNGDAAIDLLLDAHEKALGSRASGDHRTQIIHSQFVRRDQLDRYAALHLVPSFYTEHTYFFGTTHVKNRGPEQAAFLSPLRTASDLGIRFTNHTDFNVAPIDQLFTVWTAVTRHTREGPVLGPHERITPYEALQALTSTAAWAYREEAAKGTLEPGKLADLVVLDADPLTVPPEQIKDIRVLETIKEGKTVYRAR